MTANLDLKKSVKNDYMLTYSILFFIVFLGFSGYFKYSGEEMNFILIFLAVSILGLIGFILRLNHLRKILSSSFEVEATITKKWFYRSRGGAKYNYSIHGVDYKASNYLMKNRMTNAIRKDDIVTILVDENNYKKTIIKKLYVK